jgi:hypothetical protein
MAIKSRDGTQRQLRYPLPKSPNDDQGKHYQFRSFSGLDDIPGFSKEEIDQVLSHIPNDRQKISMPDTLHQDKLKENQQRFIRVVTELRELLDGSMDYVQIWLRSPNPQLGGRTALSYLLEGKIEVVEGLVYAMNTGQPI